MSSARREILPDDVAHFRHLPTRQWLPAKALYDDDKEALDWLLEPLSHADRERFGQFSESPSTDSHGRSAFKSVDASIMEIADDIAYGVHDLEDAIVVGLINRELWLEQMFPTLQALASSFTDFDAVELTDNLFSSHHYERKAAIGSLVNRILTSSRLVTQDQQFESSLLVYKAQLASPEQQLLNALKQFIFKFVIRKPEMQVQEFKGQQIVMELFDALAVEPDRLLPENTAARYQAAQQKGLNAARVISDYLSGMTDAYAAKLHQDLFSVQPPRM